MSRNEKITNDEMEQFTTGCCDQSKIGTKSGYRNVRCQEYNEVKKDSLTKTFDDYGDKLNQDNGRIERTKIAESRMGRTASRKEDV